MILTSNKACTNVMNNKFDRLSLTEVQTYCDLILQIFSSLHLQVLIVLYDQLLYSFSFNFQNILVQWITCNSTFYIKTIVSYRIVSYSIVYIASYHIYIVLSLELNCFKRKLNALELLTDWCCGSNIYLFISLETCLKFPKSVCILLST